MKFWFSSSARTTLVVLTLINAVNYIDRFLIAALLPQLQRDLVLTDAQAGSLATAFIVVYMLISPLFGWLGDRGPRLRWLALGVSLWSTATAFVAVVKGYVSLLVLRGLLGVGEAAYGSLSPSIISDHFPKELRGRAMSIFFLAIPVGSAMGYLLGGVLGDAVGWRWTFVVVGAPGLLLAGILLFLREPQRGLFDGDTQQEFLGFRAGLSALLKNRLYVWTVWGYTAYTFAIGGLAFWAPSYLTRIRGGTPAQSMMVFGAMTVVTGVLGTMLGGWLGDRLQKYTPAGYTWLSVGCTLVGGGIGIIGFMSESYVTFMTLLGLSEFVLFLNTGPVNTLMMNSVPPRLRGMASAFSILTIHLLGDAISPSLIGFLSDRIGLHDAMLVVPVVFVLASILWSRALRLPHPS